MRAAASRPEQGHGGDHADEESQRDVVRGTRPVLAEREVLDAEIAAELHSPPPRSRTHVAHLLHTPDPREPASG